MMNINGLHNETSFKMRSNLLKLNENSVNNSKLNQNIIKCGDYVKLTIRRTTVREEVYSSKFLKFNLIFFC